MSGAGAGGQPVIVLAAGLGRRMGQPKVFAEHKGNGFLRRILDRCAETGARVTLVSDPRHRERLEGLLAGLPPGLLAPFPRIVESDGDLDMLDSVRAALRAGPHEPGFWLWPVDAPFISASGWRQAAETAARDPNVVWKPRSGGRSGHPVWFPAQSSVTLLDGHWPDGLRGYLKTVPPEHIRFIDLEGEFLEDIDTPEKLAGLGWLD